MAVNEGEMDSTKDLINANHVAVLRELNGVKDSLAVIHSDLRDDRDALKEHNAEDGRRFSAIEQRLSVLVWGYGLGAVVFASGLVMVMRMLMGG